MEQPPRDIYASSKALARYASLPRDASGKMAMTDAQWRDFLSPEAYRILREAGTERAFTGVYTDTEVPGKYHCLGCGEFLYDSSTKFHSGCGWSSFEREVSGAVVRVEDISQGMIRTEICCRVCDGHLGHVFTGEHLTEANTRHCVNSAALLFVPAEGADSD